MAKINVWLSIVLLSIIATGVQSQRSLFDQDLYENSLDPDLCDRQLLLIFNETVFALPFLDAGIRLPRGILEGNLVDKGNYHQCLAIKEDIEDTTVEGKYCSITIPLDQEISLPDLPILPEIPIIPPQLFSRIVEYEEVRSEIYSLTHPGQGDLRTTDDRLLAGMSLTLALCIPKTCTTRQTLASIADELEFTENFCRLPNDKPSAPADYVAISIFSVIGLLVLLSTSYDLMHVFYLKKEPRDKNILYSSFSVYTNTQRLLTFKSGADSLDCLDGIRAISIIWVMVGHTHSTALSVALQNPLSALEWMQSARSIWIMAAPLSVDTFFLMSGLLCAYTVAKKATRWSFFKNIPMFYLHRYLRIFPLLAAAILLQVSLAHHLGDGPNWDTVAIEVESCRKSWWIALLHLQNYVSGPICIGQTWYLSVDMQLYWLSPIVLVWLCAPRHGDGRRTGWFAVTLAVLTSLLAATIFCFLNDFPSHPMTRPLDSSRYMADYYINTLSRAPPFFIGIMFGYVLHLWRDTKVHLPKIAVCVLWLSAVALSSFTVFIHYPIMQPGYDNQTLDNFLNSYMRSFWAIAVGWTVFACKHGYAGPINWFLSLHMWKLPARLSFAIYLLHMSAMININSMILSPLYFAEWNFIFRFFADFVLAVILAVIVTLAVDSPFSILQKILFESGGAKRPQHKPPVHDVPKAYDIESRIDEGNEKSSRL